MLTAAAVVPPIAVEAVAPLSTAALLVGALEAVWKFHLGNVTGVVEEAAVGREDGYSCFWTISVWLTPESAVAAEAIPPTNVFSASL